MTYVAVAAGGVALGSAGIKYFKGRSQQKKGEALERSNIRPIYTRPGEVTTALNVAERNFNNGMPGSSLAENRLGSNAATAYGTATEGATSSGDLLDAATKINGNTNRASNDLAVQEANYKSGAMQNYIAQLMANGAYGDKEFDYNQNQPFQETAAKAASLIGAGNQNQNTAINEVGQVANSVLMSQMNPDGQSGGRQTATPVNNSIAPVTQAQIPNGFDPTSRGKMVYDPATQTYKFMQ